MEQTKHQNFILFKPYGYLSQFVNNQTKRTKKKLLGELYDFPKNTMAIGRLDEPSEGLLLLTTDGKTSEFIRSNKIEKEYYAQVDGKITNEAIELLKNGIEISTETGKYLTKKCIVEKLEKTPELPERAKKIRDERHRPTSWVSVTLTEGKFRQVRKMTAAAGFPTLRLVRVRIGKFTINNMQSGQVIKINY
jgi:23S rRNA pseudouridine2457 synthase